MCVSFFGDTRTESIVEECEVIGGNIIKIGAITLHAYHGKGMLPGEKGILINIYSYLACHVLSEPNLSKQFDSHQFL